MTDYDQPDQPAAETSRTMDVRPGLWASMATLVIMVAVAAWAWRRIPASARIPIHWDAGGHANQYAGKAAGLLTPPLVALGIAAVLAVVPRIDPRRTHLARSARAYNAIWIALLALLLGIYLTTTLRAAGWRLDPGRWVIAGTGLLFMVAGNYLPKLRSNWFAGIRTPWTLSSERSWQRTHRLGARLFAVAGLLLVLSALLAPSWVQAPALLGTLGALVVVLSAYSWAVWRADPGKQPIGR